MKRTRVGKGRFRLGRAGNSTWLVLAGMALLHPLGVRGQGVVVGKRVCPPGQVAGTLGISGLDCVGECSVALSSDGREQTWSFSVEPRVLKVQPGGPVDGILQEGDLLAAIDGVLIATREGGRRFANLEPGTAVKITFRRGGVVRDAIVRVGAECAEPVPVKATGRVAPLPPVEPSEPTAVTAPRIRVLPPVAPDSAEPPAVARSVSIAAGRFLDSGPRGRLGLGFSCTRCGIPSDEPGGKSTWFFSGPVEVTQVTTGGPAEEAGIRIGDFITAIDGKELTTEAGGAAFAGLVPGEPVTVTLTRRNGREETVTVVPTDQEPLPLVGRAAPAAPTAPREPAGVAVTATPPAGASRPAAEPRAPVPPEPMADVFSGPEGLPVSYSGNVEGVEVVVRGGPVSVSEMRGARTVIINAEGLWIRIRIPGGAPRAEGRSGGGS